MSVKVIEIGYGEIPEEHALELEPLLRRIDSAERLDARGVDRIISEWASEGHAHPKKSTLFKAYLKLVNMGKMQDSRKMRSRLQLKPVRTSSGVAPVTVLTKPFPCPGKCIFCPDDVRMPKSYLPDEPGAMRAAMHKFDPYSQTASRIAAFENIGHSAAKVELLILGGTWSAYPKDYQEWFVKRCLDAMNGVDSESLEEAQRINESSSHRNVGLVVETRPDWITKEEVIRLRRLGVTKVQLGAQSFDDCILELNKRGHDVEATKEAIRLLRLGGFKIVLHWMPNLYGATPESDYADFQKLWKDPALRPDELKIYPTSLLRGTELYRLWEEGKYTPYTDEQLIELMIKLKLTIPRYCRLNRLMRDIPSPNIVAGYKHTNLRQIVQQEMRRRGQRCRCIRCREIRRLEVNPETLKLEILPYRTDATQEYFLSYVTPDDRIAGFLRLSLPNTPESPIVEELKGRAMIREVHVYGPALEIGKESAGEAQHSGIGARLIALAKGIAREHGFEWLAVISAIGTRNYYRKHGFELQELYMHSKLT